MTNDRIYLSPPDVTECEEASLIRAFRSGWIAPLGPEVDAFESELALYSGRKHAVALSSGTAALHLGLLTMGVRPGDYVLTSTMTFAATANAILYSGATPVFIDTGVAGNMDASVLDSAFTSLASQRIHPKVVLPVDLFGKAADHISIAEIAKNHNALVLADSAESLGATHKGRQSAAYGSAAAVSFNGNKIITTSGGGALLTDNPEQASRVRHLATQAREPYAHYQHNEVGYNYRLSNLLAALGRAQLSRLDELIEKRRSVRTFYRNLFDDIPGIHVFGEPSFLEKEQTRDNYWLTSITVDPDTAGYTAEQLRIALAGANIEARPLWKPLHLQPAYRKHPSFITGRSESLFNTGLSLPSGSTLTGADLARIATCIVRFCQDPPAA